MNNFFAVLWAEGLKIFRSKIFWVTILAFALFPAMQGFYMFILKYPHMFGSEGFIGRIANIAGKADWQSYFAMITQSIPGGVGGVGFGFVASWVFGREYSNHTVKDLLALPVSRLTIVSAKFIAILLWCILLTMVLMLTMLGIGNAIHLDGWSIENAAHYIYLFASTSLFTMLLCSPVGLLASLGRGYLAPMGFVGMVFAIAQFIGSLGFGAYFPWAIPALYSGAGGSESAQLGAVSFIILFMTVILGLIGSFAWWRYADQT